MEFLERLETILYDEFEVTTTRVACVIELNEHGVLGSTEWKMRATLAPDLGPFLDELRIPGHIEVTGDLGTTAISPELAEQIRADLEQQRTGR
jgi:hypothetical protein